MPAEIILPSLVATFYQIVASFLRYVKGNLIRRLRAVLFEGIAQQQKDGNDDNFFRADFIHYLLLAIFDPGPHIHRSKTDHFLQSVAPFPKAKPLYGSLHEIVKKSVPIVPAAG